MFESDACQPIIFSLPNSGLFANWTLGNEISVQFEPKHNGVYTMKLWKYHLQNGDRFVSTAYVKYLNKHNRIRNVYLDYLKENSFEFWKHLTAYYTAAYCYWYNQCRQHTASCNQKSAEMFCHDLMCNYREYSVIHLCDTYRSLMLGSGNNAMQRAFHLFPFISNRSTGLVITASVFNGKGCIMFWVELWIIVQTEFIAPCSIKSLFIDK